MQVEITDIQRNRWDYDSDFHSALQILSDEIKAVIKFTDNKGREVQESFPFTSVLKIRVVDDE
jgi:hypothetical protein